MAKVWEPRRQALASVQVSSRNVYHVQPCAWPWARYWEDTGGPRGRRSNLRRMSWEKLSHHLGLRLLKPCDPHNSFSVPIFPFKTRIRSFHSSDENPPITAQHTLNKIQTLEDRKDPAQSSSCLLFGSCLSCSHYSPAPATLGFHLSQDLTMLVSEGASLLCYVLYVECSTSRSLQAGPLSSALCLNVISPPTLPCAICRSPLSHGPV